MRNRPLGSLVGGAFGLVFVLVNAGGLPSALVLPVRLLGVVALVAVVLAVVRGPEVRPVSPSPRAWRTYWLCVVAEVVAIPVGANLLTRVLDHPELVLSWVVLVVGVHFLPFSRTFDAPVFGWLAAALVVVAVLGGVAASVGTAHAPAWTGVVAGLVLLGFAGAGPWVGRAHAVPLT